MKLRDVRTWLRENRTDPIVWTELTQVGKTVLAGTLAWWVAAPLLHLPQPFLAPWAALLVVHATVYRTFARGAQQASGAVVGVLLAWAVGNLLGLDTLAVAVSLLLGLGVGALPWFAGEATTIAATAVVVLTTGLSADDQVLLSRLLDTGIGIGCGLLVSVAIWPPLRRRTTVRAVDVIDDAIGQLLGDIADGLRADPDEGTVSAWVDRTREIDGQLDHAWAMVRQSRESARLNPRRRARASADPMQWTAVLRRMEQAVAETRSLARTVGGSIVDVEEWDEEFRERWVGLLRRAGTAVAAADPKEIAAVHLEVGRLAADLSRENLPAMHWPLYGGLIINLRNIVTAMDLVAEVNPIEGGGASA
ncbi:MAG: FUSC family protein [Nocardioidaceae bacterium]